MSLIWEPSLQANHHLTTMSATPKVQQFACVTSPIPSPVTKNTKMFHDTPAELVGKIEEMIYTKQQEALVSFAKRPVVSKCAVSALPIFRPMFT